MSFARNLGSRYGEKVFNTVKETGTDGKKTVFKKIPHNTAKAIGKVTGSNITNKTVKPKSILEANLRNVEEIVIPTRKRQEILNVLDKYYRMEFYKISKLLNGLTASKIVTRRWIEVNDLPGCHYSVKNIRLKTPMLWSHDYSV